MPQNMIEPKTDEARIADARTYQLMQEQDTWGRALEFMRQENVHLKNRLADIISQDSRGDFLEQAELFQNYFLHKDMVIELLKHDISEQRRSTTAPAADAAMLYSRQNRLRSDIEKTEADFIRLKTDFNQYLSEFL